LPAKAATGFAWRFRKLHALFFGKIMQSKGGVPEDDQPDSIDPRSIKTEEGELDREALAAQSLCCGIEGHAALLLMLCCEVLMSAMQRYSYDLCAVDWPSPTCTGNPFHQTFARSLGHCDPNPHGDR